MRRAGAEGPTAVLPVEWERCIFAGVSIQSSQRVPRHLRKGDSPPNRCSQQQVQQERLSPRLYKLLVPCSPR